MTTQREIRQAFWADNPTLSRKRGRDGDYLTDTRVAFCDYVEILSRAGIITKKLAYRVTLNP